MTVHVFECRWITERRMRWINYEATDVTMDIDPCNYN